MFAVLAPQWWNELPIDIKTTVTHPLLQIENSSVQMHLDPWENKKQKKLFLIVSVFVKQFVIIDEADGLTLLMFGLNPYD